MAEIIRMPKMSDTMEEGVIASWQKKEGDTISAGDILAEVETDKATMELESYQDGTLLHIGVQEKEAVLVDGVIAIIGDKGEDISALLNSIQSEPASSVKENNDPVSEETDEEDQNIDVSSINASVIQMPKMSDTMEEGVIASWQKKVGDKVTSGDILAEVETDKATMELEAYEDGYLLYTAVNPGESVPIDGVIAIIGEKDADFELLLKARNKKPAPEKSLPVDEPAKTEVEIPVTTNIKSTSDNGRTKASPLAKKLASEKGIDIGTVQGSGEGGRIIKRDIENWVPSASVIDTPKEKGHQEPAMVLPRVVGEESYEDVTLSQMRKVIARRLSDSKFTSPHFYLNMEINMDKAIEARKSLNEISPVKISFNDMIIKAVAAALRQHPDVNVSWMEDKLRKNHHIHIGVAVAIPDGLIVPVVKFADNKSLSHISAEVKELAKKAAEKKLQPEEFEGNTFTISNLGMFGIEDFTAIINPPDACILAIGGIKQTAIVKDGQLVPGNVMKVTLSCDHRAVDGAIGAAFLKSLKDLLEDPVRILI